MSKFTFVPFLALSALLTLSAETPQNPSSPLKKNLVLTEETTENPLPVASDQSSARIREHANNSLYRKHTAHKKEKRPLTYNAGPKVNDGIDCTLALEFLYLKASTNGYTYTETGFVNPSTITHVIDTVSNPNQVITTKGTTYIPPSSYKPGFRVTLGAMLDHAGWDIAANYLWFYSSNSRSAVTDIRHPFQLMDNSPSFNAIEAYYGSDFYPTKHRFTWSQRYQIADITLGRNYYTNRYLKLRPVIGLKGTWQKKYFDLDYTYKNIPQADFSGSAPNFSTPPYMLQTKNFSKAWGIGPFAGLHSSWHFTDHLSIYGSFSISEFFFQQETRYKQNIVYISDQEFANFEYPQNVNYIAPLTEANLVYVTDNSSYLKPMLDCSIGLRAETYFSDFSYHILFQLGWEAQYWPNQIMFIRASEIASALSTPTVDFFLQGATAKLRFDF